MKHLICRFERSTSPTTLVGFVSERESMTYVPVGLRLCSECGNFISSVSGARACLEDQDEFAYCQS